MLSALGRDLDDHHLGVVRGAEVRIPLALAFLLAPLRPGLEAALEAGVVFGETGQLALSSSWPCPPGRTTTTTTADNNNNSYDLI